MKKIIILRFTPLMTDIGTLKKGNRIREENSLFLNGELSSRLLSKNK